MTNFINAFARPVSLGSASKEERQGFTLIELLVVIAIIITLATLLILNLNNAQKRARDAKRVAVVGQLSVAVEQFKLDNSNTAPVPANWKLPGTGLLDYVRGSFPVDPSNAGIDYGYARHTSTDKYQVWTQLEVGSGGVFGNDDDINSTLAGWTGATRGTANGLSEGGCANGDIIEKDCVYDIGQP